jgi:Phosphotransferase enzyme family
VLPTLGSLSAVASKCGPGLRRLSGLHWTTRTSCPGPVRRSAADTSSSGKPGVSARRTGLRPVSLAREISERGGVEQLLHGEPHPGNVLTTKNGLLSIDLETCCRGLVEFDLAHAPEEVSGHCPGVNRRLLRECRIIVLAMIIRWRWDRGDNSQTGASSAQSCSARSEQRSKAKSWISPADPGISRSR